MQTINQTDSELIARTLSGDQDSFGVLVERYRDMVYGVAYSYVGDFDTARDLAQEVFVRIYQHLGGLRDQGRFPAYVRRMVVNECRACFRERRRMVDYASLPEIAVDEQGQTEARLLMRQALRCLSLPVRQTVILFYFNEWSYEEIAAFLDVPLTTIKSRLRDARNRLRKEMIEMLEETIQSAPLPETFSEDVLRRLFQAVSEYDNETVTSLLAGDARLALSRLKCTPIFEKQHIIEVAASHNNRSAFQELADHGALEDLSPEEAQLMLYDAAFHQNETVAAIALQHGARMDIFTAALIGDTRTVHRLLKEDPTLVHARGPQGETPLHDAGNVETARILLEYGADIEAIDTTYGNTPAGFARFAGMFSSVSDYLIERGAVVWFDLACSRNDVHRVRKYLERDPAVVNDRSPGRRPEAHSLPIVASAGAGALEVVELLLESGADVNTRDELRDGETALHNAARRGYRELVAFLLAHDADPTIRTLASGKTARDYAADGKRRGWMAEVGIAEHDAVIALLS